MLIFQDLKFICKNNYSLLRNLNSHSNETGDEK